MTAKRDTAAAQRFYESALSAAERAELPAALGVKGVDEEIAVLRLRLRAAIQEEPQDLELMLKGVDRLARMVATKYGLDRGEREGLSAFARETARRLREREQEAADDA